MRYTLAAHLIVALVATVWMRPTVSLTAQTALVTPAIRAADPVTALTPVLGESITTHGRTRFEVDLEVVQAYRPGYPFWQHIFTIPDGHIAYGSAADGRLLAAFPVGGNWATEGEWTDGSLAPALREQRLPRRLGARRDEVERVLTDLVGPVVHNPTRGLFFLPNAERYGDFLAEWGRIFERFGVPAEIGLAQAILESGWNGRVRSGARALGFCQWLPRNWNKLKRLSPHVIEGYNQTTQAAYCAAHLTILSTMYGSFIPALSEHHAGGVNVGRTLINGERLGADDIREQYLMGSQFLRDLRQVSIPRYRELFRSYGPRSFRYAEMVFGNIFNVRRLMADTPQTQIFATRVPRSTSLAEIVRTTALSEDEVKRFNPALVRRVPARATLYLPSYREEFGADVSFWHRPADATYADLLDEFLGQDATVREWHERSFVQVLREFATRFKNTDTEEGIVMAASLTFVIADLGNSPRPRILEEYRASARIQRLFERGRRELAEQERTCCARP